MPSRPTISAEAIALKLTPSGERFIRISTITAQHGVAHLLARRKSKPPFLLVDLYDTGEVQFEQKPESPHNGFLKDFELSRRRHGIGRSYAALDAAARLSNFFLANPVHPGNEASVFDLARKALDALDAGHSPEAVLIKTYFAYCRDEGYPVAEDWARGLDDTTRRCATQILNTPLKDLDIAVPNLRHCLDALTQYIERETHVHLA